MNQLLFKLARPYARAVFEIAQEKKALPLWENYLLQISKICADENVRKVLHNPNTTAQIRSGLINKILSDQNIRDKEVFNFTLLLANYHRLPLMPQIYELFLQLKREYEQIVPAEVTSAIALSAEEEEKLKKRLEKVFNKKVIIKNTADKNLLGGFSVKTGDRVMDYSLLGELDRLKQKLLNKDL